MFSCATAHHVFLWHYSLYQWRHHSDQEPLGDSDGIVVGDGPFTVNHRGPSVRPRGDTLFFPQSESHVQHLLKHSMFASNSVSAFIPPRLACSRGLVRAIDANMTPTEILELFCQQVLFQFIHCGRVAEKNKIPNESVIVTFAESVRPPEIKAWPFIYRVESFSPRPLQCVKCWRYRPTLKGCRPAVRCRVCGERHNSSEC